MSLSLQPLPKCWLPSLPDISNLRCAAAHGDEERKISRLQKKKTTKHFVVQHQSKVLTESEVLPGALTKTTTLSLSRSWNPTKLIPQTLKATDPTNPKIMAPKTKVI
jgi:hypothetical protein